MKFLYPTFLFALFAVLLPIIIHLFSFKRYKTVYFSHVGFLKDIKKESEKKSKIKQLLLLASRILTIVFLVLAFAEPYIPVGDTAEKHNSKLVAVYVDNSYSMNALSEQGQLLEVARNKALEICLAHPAGTKFRLFTNDLHPKHQHIYNREQFIREVSSIQPSPKHTAFSVIYNRFADQHPETENKVDKNIYFLSDFQRSVSDFENFKPKSVVSYYMPLVPNEVANLYIDSCWVEVPAHQLGQEEQIFVRIKNSSAQNYQNLPLKMYLNDSIKSITNFSVNAQNEIIAELTYTNNTSGPQLGKIEITDYPFTHDNNWYVSYQVAPRLKAVAITNTANDGSETGLNYLKALFENDEYVQLEEMNMQSLQVNRLNEFNTIFLVNPSDFSGGFLNELEGLVKNGVSVVLFPSTDKQVPNNNFLSVFRANRISGIDSTRQKIEISDFENAFFSQVFSKKEENPILPETERHLRFENTTRSGEDILLQFQNGDKALSQLNYNEGKVWIFSFPLNKHNESFARDVLFVPTMYNIVLNSLPRQNMSYTVGENTFAIMPRNANLDLNSNIEVSGTKNNETFIPGKNITSRGVRIDFNEEIQDDGHYLVKNNNEIVATLAFNYNRKESDLRYLSNTEIEQRLELNQIVSSLLITDVDKNFAEIFDVIQNGKQLWKWFILLALLFIVAEVLIARFWK